MEKEIKPTETTAIPKVPVQLPRKDFPKTAILLIIILLVGISGVYVGMQIGKKQMSAGLIPKITPTLVPQPTETSTPTSDETANWKTYRNDKYGFELKYPLNWQVTEGQRIDVTNEEKQCFFSIDYSNPRKVTLPIEGWFKKVMKEAEMPCNSPGCTAVGTESFEGKEIIDGVEAYKYGQAAGMGESVGYFIPYKGKIVTIGYSLDFYYELPKEGQTTYCEDKSNQILSTFKFTQ